MAAKETPAEILLKKVRKIEENLVCPNCGTFNQYGFGNVCVKFKTFVCDLCKTSVELKYIYINR
jgi:transposase-like protein